MALKHTTCRITAYTIGTGYNFRFGPGGSATDVHRITRFTLVLTDDSTHPEHDPITLALVDFGDQGAGPVISAGRLTQGRAEVSFPRDELQAFQHALDIFQLIDIAWNESDELVQFVVTGDKSLAPNEETRARIDSLRREFGGGTST